MIGGMKMKRLTKQQIKEIKESKKGLLETARQFKVNPNTIKYHRLEEFRNYLREYAKERYRKMTKEQKRKNLDKKKEFQRNYQNKRYHKDKEFREKQLERAKKYQREKYIKKESIQQ